jgi:hypothetical protein
VALPPRLPGLGILLLRTIVLWLAQHNLQSTVMAHSPRDGQGYPQSVTDISKGIATGIQVGVQERMRQGNVLTIARARYGKRNSVTKSILAGGLSYCLDTVGWRGSCALASTSASVAVARKAVA